MKPKKMKKNDLQKKYEKEYKVTVEFLKQTKQGKYAPVEKGIRIKEETEIIEYYEEEYYYSLS